MSSLCDATETLLAHRPDLFDYGQINAYPFVVKVPNAGLLDSMTHKLQLNIPIYTCLIQQVRMKVIRCLTHN